MEPIFYEYRPWAFVVLGVYSMATSEQSTLLFLSGLTLAGAAGLILLARSTARSRRF